MGLFSRPAPPPPPPPPLTSFQMFGVIPDFMAPLLLAVVLLLAGYKSFKAIESPVKEDDTRWLTFWFVYAIIVSLWRT